MRNEILIVLGGIACLAAFWWVLAEVDRRDREESEAYFQRMVQPALDTCHQRGGIANRDAWGKVVCDR